MSWPPKFAKYPSTEQFRTVVADVLKFQERNQILEPFTVSFTGTVKLHGTNAAVLWDFNDDHELVCQSRSHRITPQQDNAGFATFISKALVTLEIKKLMRQLQATGAGGAAAGDVMVLYGEWCGNGIQKGVAIAELSPMFVIFAGQVQSPTTEPVVDAEAEAEAETEPEPEDQDQDQVQAPGPEEPVPERHWISKERLKELMPDPKTKIFHVFQFPTWTIDIKFKQPELGIAQTELSRLTMMVESECPVGRHFGVHGVGEGIVWRGSLNGRSLVFKVKGDKHSVTKVRKLAAVDIEKLTGITEFLEYSVTCNRMEQGYTELFGSGSAVPESRDVAQFIKWVIADVVKEESDTMAAAGITVKDMGKMASDIARKRFFQRLKI
jgi:hypothetical protein